MKKVAFHTLGCKVNTYESEAMKKLFESDGYEVVDFKEVADVYVVNTCTVTNTGDSKSRQMIRRAIRKNPDACVCVTGCYSQVATHEIEEIEGVGVILGTQYRHDIVRFANDFLQTGIKQVHVDNIMNTKRFEDLHVASFSENTRAFLKIQDGCNNFCTYCIIPYARGLVRSRPKESVIKEAQELVDHGFVEIVLTGIHTAGYGMDLDNYRFVDLLADITSEVKGLKRLRISSIETSQITQEVIDLISHDALIVDHLHIPIQSGCNSVLKRMNRKYTTEQYYDNICQIREVLPDIAITTDVIVGFPQETEEEFESIREFIEKVGFSELHVFPYSKRKNTPASRMSGQIDEQEKNRRTHILLTLSKSLHRDYANKFIGKQLEVIFEEKNKEGYFVGHASNYLKVRIKDDTIELGKPTQVIMTDYIEPFCDCRKEDNHGNE